ncbi:MAG: hypothetical protein K9H26_10085 [Prolixibacteraceae bacterium]|nr:hypothetical protein [Prolixibacteraceae bacterium]
MNRKEKHTVTLRIGLLKNTGSLCLALFFFFMVSGSFASGQATEKTYTAENGNVVFTVTAENSLTITEGKITATPGNSIKLLPGTHIKNGKQLAINIADKDCQEAVAKAAAREREETMLARVTKKQENNLLPHIDTKTRTVCTKGEAPATKSTLGQQSLHVAAIAPTTTPTLKVPVSDIHNNKNIQNIYNTGISASYTYTPTRMWGDKAETVKVMRC